MSTKTAFSVFYAYLIGLILIIGIMPEWLNDENEFFKNFINHEYVNVLGVILAITLASLAQIHFSLNSIEEKNRKKIFSETREEIVSTIFWLIGGFAFGLLIVIVKPLVADREVLVAVLNGVAMGVLLFYLFLLADITLSVFSIEADIDEPKDEPSEGLNERED